MEEAKGWRGEERRRVEVGMTTVIYFLTLGEGK